MQDKLLLIPGPTNLSKRVRDSMSGAQVPHVGSEFYGDFKEILSLSRYVFRNEKGFQFVFSGSGTIGMESSVVSLVARGDPTLTLTTGYFGRRMLMLNQVHGAKADSLDYPDGGHADPDDLRKKLQKARYKVVFMTHVDTATSVQNPIRELVDECRKAGVLCVVDSVCGVGGVPLEFDKLGADIAFTASQKALAGVPGAVLIAASERALDYMEKRKEPIDAYYMNLLRWKPIMEDPHIYLATPSIQVLLALREALSEVKEEGMEKRWQRHRELGDIARTAVEEMGEECLADEGYRAETVTSFKVRSRASGTIQQRLEEEYGIVVSRGIGDLRDSVVRVGHFGILTPTRLKSAMRDLGTVVAELGLSGRKMEVAKRA